MKKALSLWCILALLSCKNTEKNGTTDDKIQKTEKSENSPNVKTIDFAIKIVQPYCGGAAPSDEMENQRMKGEVARDFSFFVLEKGGEPKKITTNGEGSATLELPNGEYCLKEAYKCDNELINALDNSDWELDEECFEEWKTICNKEFSVSDTGATKIEFTYYPRCGWEGPVPCITNTGFPPP